MHHVDHPVWGSNIGNQLVAKPISDPGDNNSSYRVQRVPGWFGRETTRRVYVGNNKIPAADTDNTARCFRHRCGLLKVVLMPGPQGPEFVAFLDGHVTSRFSPDEVSFHFAELGPDGGKPVADVEFWVNGPRKGPFTNYATTRLMCMFVDQAQMDQYVDVSNRRMPKAITHKGVTYRSNGSGEYHSDDGSALPLMVAMYLMLGPNEQQAFAAQNPDVRAMVSGGDGDFGGGGATGDFNSDAPASGSVPDGVSYGDDAASQVGGGDGGISGGDGGSFGGGDGGGSSGGGDGGSSSGGGD